MYRVTMRMALFKFLNMPGTVRAFFVPKIFEGRSGRAPRAPLT
jgi:hypothetical protein